MLRIPLLLVLLFTFAACEQGAKSDGSAPPLCDIHKGPCEGYLDDGTPVRFDIGPKPVKALQDLQFSVSIEGVNDAKVIVDLTMPAMYMGENQVTLIPSGNGTYTGTGSIVKCASGDRLWDAAVIVERAGKQSKTHFRFETMP